MLFELPIMLCSNSQHKANNVRCFIPIMLSIYSVLQVSTHHKPGFITLYDSFNYTFLCSGQTTYYYTRLDCSLNVRKVSCTVQYCSWFLDYLMFKPIMPALCWHTETAYYAQSNASILCLSLLLTRS